MTETEGTIRILFTRRAWNPISWLIRWGMPRSRFAFALSSHCIIDTGDKCYEATMIYGVRETDLVTVLKGQTIVRSRAYTVPDLPTGLAWIKSQLCPYEPNPPAWLPQWAQVVYATAQRIRHSNYDWGGASGLSLAPDRDWAEEDRWWCYELAGGFLRACGRRVFSSLSHVGETALLALDD